MVYCPRCGKELPEGAVYCDGCGQKLSGPTTGPAESGFDQLRTDVRAQGLWLSRLIAYIIDSVIVGLIVALFAVFLFVPMLVGSLLARGWWDWTNIVQIPFALGLFQLIYFTVLEGGYDASVGKRIMGLRVERVDGASISFLEAFIRNVSKLHAGLLLIDILLGLLVSGDPGRKFTDLVASTRVVGWNPILGLPPRGRWEADARRVGDEVREAVREVREEIREEVRGPAREARGEWRRREPDYMGGVGFGVFLIIVAWVFLQYPAIGQWFIDWFKEWQSAGPTALPVVLVEPMSLFFLAFGGWEILSGFIRWGVGGRLSAAVSDVAGGLFGVALGYAFREYGAGVIAWGSMLPIFIILVGGSILLSAFFSLAIRDR